MSKDTRVKSSQQRAQEWFSAASLGAGADAYVRYLAGRGYADGTIRGYFGSVAHFVHWLSRERIGLKSISEELIDRFLYRHLPHCRCAPECRRARNEVRAALKHFLAMLRASGTCLQEFPSVPAAISTELGDFSRRLVEARGLSDSTCAVRLRHVRDFLADRFGTGPIRISTVAPADVACFVRRYTQEWAPGSIKTVGISLRSYFQFKTSQGAFTKALVAALPRVNVEVVLEHKKFDNLAQVGRTGKPRDGTLQTPASPLDNAANAW